MYNGKIIAVVVPAFNEEKLIGKTLGTIPHFVDLVVTINDGSTDQTAAMIEKSRDKVQRLIAINNEQNIGLGASLWKGYARCDEEGADIFVVMAGDAQMDPLEN